MPEDRDDFFPDDWEIRFDEDDEKAEVETDWDWSTIYFDEDAARQDGYDPDSENYRGLFFSMEDAEEYARTIGLPVVFVETEAGIEVYIDYEETA